MYPIEFMSCVSGLINALRLTPMSSSKWKFPESALVGRACVHCKPAVVVLTRRSDSEFFAAGKNPFVSLNFNALRELAAPRVLVLTFYTVCRLENICRYISLLPFSTQALAMKLVYSAPLWQLVSLWE